MSIEILKQRHSVRKYQNRPVEREKLEAIVDAARFAPTARNEQPWEFVIVTDPERCSQLGGLTDYGKFIAEAPACIVVFCRDTKYYLEDGSAATTYIMLAATSLSLGSCWVAGDKKAYAEQVREFLGVPTGYKLLSLVSIGYPVEEQPKSKRSLAEVAHWGAWNKD
ncbi:MAG: nitroreductase family protein [Firmicutes bacterium]|nr:nitroreductase family protein [Bacillota bacterium]